MTDNYAQRIFWSAADLSRVKAHFGPSLSRDFGAAPRSASLSADFTATRANGSASPRSFTFTISTSSIDRMGDSISLSGWKLAAFDANPVVLFAHASDVVPVGRATKTWIAGGKLKSTVELAEGASRFAGQVGDLIEGGYLRTASVGFRPLKYAFVDDPARKYGIDFLEQELLEWSIVPVPANADAVIDLAQPNKAADPQKLRRMRELEIIRLRGTP